LASDHYPLRVLEAVPNISSVEVGRIRLSSDLRYDVVVPSVADVGKRAVQKLAHFPDANIQTTDNPQDIRVVVDILGLLARRIATLGWELAPLHMEIRFHHPTLGHSRSDRRILEAQNRSLRQIVLRRRHLTRVTPED
jgi:hypothetical protein